MTLVERFIEIQGWSTSRKVALAAAYTLVVSVVQLGFGGVLLSPTGWIDMTFWWTIGGLFAAFALVMALVAWWVSQSSDGGWTVWAFGVPYSGLLIYFIWAIGPLSTAFLVFAPMSAVFAIVLFTERLGRVASVLVATSTAAYVVIAVAGWFPYAPMIDERSVDAAAEPRVALAVGLAVLMMTAGNLGVTWLVVSAGRLTSARLDAAQKLIARYVPAEVAEDILLGRLSDVDGHERRKLTVFFSDLVGFSDVAEELEPEDLALVLNEYFGTMTTIAHRHHGTVDELQGDALLILFGAPRATTDREHALNAVRMAGEMHAAMAALNVRWRKAGITETLAVRMGINTGVVTIGNFGTPTRMKYAALGKHVNIAARLQAIAQPGTTVVSYATYLLVEDEVSCTALGPQQLKGITKPVEAFTLN